MRLTPQTLAAAVSVPTMRIATAKAVLTLLGQAACTSQECANIQTGPVQEADLRKQMLPCVDKYCVN